MEEPGDETSRSSSSKPESLNLAVSVCFLHLAVCRRCTGVSSCARPCPRDTISASLASSPLYAGRLFGSQLFWREGEFRCGERGRFSRAVPACAPARTFLPSPWQPNPLTRQMECLCVCPRDRHISLLYVHSEIIRGKRLKLRFLCFFRLN